MRKLVYWSFSLLSLGALAGCATQPEPTEVGMGPGSVEFSGHWNLNGADSDDPQQLMLGLLRKQIGATSDTASDPSGGQGGSGRRGRGGGQARAGGDDSRAQERSAPMPPVEVMSAALRWPGKILDITQVDAMITLVSDETKRICQGPLIGHRHSNKSANDPHRASENADRALACGWVGKSLLVETNGPDSEHPILQQRYQLSADGARLVEVVNFGGRMGAFTLSRVWDRGR